jgi:glycosyltransferase involved in cell wall biosynthesis
MLASRRFSSVGPMSHSPKKNPVALSIGIIAGNEEDSIRETLESLFRQSVFERLCIRHQVCEVIVVAQGCTDRTIAVARGLFDKLEREHDWSDGFNARVIEVPEPGRANAWNRFVHEFSAVEARFLVSMDSHIAFHHRDTVFNLMAVLERKPHVPASTGRQCKSLLFKERQTLAERLSLAASAIGGSEAGRICSQLYCLRANVARNLFLPRALEATEDGFIKEMVCTEFLTRESDPARVVLAPDAAHIFDACIRPREVLNQWQRQMIGQTAVHVLVEYLKTLPWQEQVNLADTLRRHEARDPDWLKKLLAAHLHHRPFFWQLFPGILSFRFKRLGRLPGLRKLTHVPAALAGWMVTLIACARASSVLHRAMIQDVAQAKSPAVLGVPQLGAK